MIHARMSNDHMLPACGPWIEPDGVVTNSEILVDCPLCLALLPTIKLVLQHQVEELERRLRIAAP